MKKMILLAFILGSGSLWAMEEEEVINVPSLSESAEIKQPVNPSGRRGGLSGYPHRSGLAPSESAKLSVNIVGSKGGLVTQALTYVTLEAKKLSRNVEVNIFVGGEFMETRELAPQGEVGMTFGGGGNRIEIYDGADIAGKKLLESRINHTVILVKETIFGKIKVSAAD